MMGGARPYSNAICVYLVPVLTKVPNPKDEGKKERQKAHLGHRTKLEVFLQFL